jgi:hypothetical protein
MKGTAIKIPPVQVVGELQVARLETGSLAESWPLAAGGLAASGLAVHCLCDAHGRFIWLLYGLRRGHVLGLLWRDIDEEDAEVRICQQIQRVHGELRAGSVKTSAGAVTCLC